MHGLNKNVRFFRKYDIYPELPGLLTKALFKVEYFRLD